MLHEPPGHFLQSPRLNGPSVDAKRAELKNYFTTTYDCYEDLFRCIKRDSGYYLRAEPLRHPLIFYLGHTATFFINKLLLGQYINERINPAFEAMFAIGVDEMSWDDLDSRHYDWPAVGDVMLYRHAVRDCVLKLIDTMPLSLPIQEDSLAWTLLMGIEHERIHLETSSVIIRMLPLDEVVKHPHFAPCPHVGQSPKNTLVPITGQRITLGRSGAPEIYGWDNEFGSLTVNVADFSAAKYLVSNAEYLSFVLDQGYQKPELWSTEGQDWLRFTQAKHPRFWVKKSNNYWQRNLCDEIPLPLNWPVEVNYYEAKAFCEWLSQRDHRPYRLPTEAEWMLLREHADINMSANIQLDFYASSCPIDQFQHGQCFDVIGNVWQWTESTMDAYPGFHVHKLYDDFSTPTFDGLHNLIKGGSWISTGNLATKHARYAFRRHFFQHAGFRYIQSAQHIDTATPSASYETDAAIAQYLELHYGEPYFGVKNFPQHCIDLIKPYYKKTPCKKALDLGCAVGRSSIELAKDFEQVDALDFSARFIQQAVALQQNGRVRYGLVREGELLDYKEVQVNKKDLKNINFMQADACNLKAIYTAYDLIFAGNLIDRLYEPEKFLATIADRLNPHGLLVLTSPYTWLEEYTEKTHWLGGIKVNGENQSTLAGLHAILDKKFILIETKNIEFIIRETARKFQHSIAEMSIWQLK